MAYTNINKGSDYFNTKLYTGTGSTQSITGVGFQPDFVWCKDRTNSYDHVLFDAVRGATKRIVSNTTGAETTASTDLTSFDSDGFTVGSGSNINNNGNNFASWNWKANGQGSANTDGSINTTYTSVNTTSGFSISTYTGTGSAATIGHGLGVVPAVVLVKRLNATEHWVMYHHKSNATPQDYYLRLNDLTAVADFPMWNDTAPTNQVFSVGTNDAVNASGSTYVAYCFAEKQGYSKFGSYFGNGNADGTFAYTGFKPAFILIKSVSTTNWNMFDNKRSPFNVADETLWANSTDSESTVGTSYGIDILSNGFKARTVSSQVNNSNTVHIFMAFAEASIVGTNNIAANAR